VSCFERYAEEAICSRWIREVGNAIHLGLSERRAV
jgi:hypothetical protein